MFKFKNVIVLIAVTMAYCATTVRASEVRIVKAKEVTCTVLTDFMDDGGVVDIPFYPVKSVAVLVEVFIMPEQEKQQSFYYAGKGRIGNYRYLDCRYLDGIKVLRC